MKKAFAGFSVASLLAVVASGQAASKAQPLPGLDATVTKVEHAATAALRDCPPGTNTVTAVTKPGERFALVTVAFKVAPSFKASPMKRPTVTDASDKKFNTASTFVDVGSLPEYSCTFPFRIPEGTRLKALQLESASLDLSALDK